jgi:hypothetical protein
MKKVKIYNIIKQTSGGLHSWVQTNFGTMRKPNDKLEGYKKQTIWQKKRIFEKVISKLIKKIKTMKIIIVAFITGVLFELFWLITKGLKNKKRR